ncbi:hypothetical protein ACFVT5_14700 [Streptomyces sp. NPDC058001]
MLRQFTIANSNHRNHTARTAQPAVISVVDESHSCADVPVAQPMVQR